MSGLAWGITVFLGIIGAVEIAAYALRNHRACRPDDGREWEA